MDVQYALRISGDELGREQSHVAGQADELHTMLTKAGDHLLVVLRAREPLRLDHVRVQPALLGGDNSGSVGLVGDHHRNFSVGNSTGGDGIGDGQEVRAASGEQNAELRLASFGVQVKQCNSLKSGYRRSAVSYQGSKVHLRRAQPKTPNSPITGKLTGN